MAKKKEHASHKGGGPGISRESRQALANRGEKICKRREPTPRNEAVGRCMRAARVKGKSQAVVNAAFTKCSSKGGSGRSRSGSKRGSRGGTDYSHMRF